MQSSEGKESGGLGSWRPVEAEVENWGMMGLEGEAYHILLSKGFGFTGYILCPRRDPASRGPSCRLICQLQVPRVGTSPVLKS